MIKKFIVLPLAILTIAFGTFSSASAQVASPRVALQFGTNGLTSPLNASSNDATIARLLLDTTGSTEAVRISSLPFNLVTGSGANASTLMNCRVFNEASPNVALNTPATATSSLVSGINNTTFNTPLILPANSLTTVALRCDVGSDLVAGGTYTVNMNTANVVATGVTSGLPALVTIRGSVVVPPVTVPPVVVTPTPTTPGMPATGFGGEAAQNVAMLIASVLIAGLGFSTLGTRRRV